MRKYAVTILVAAIGAGLLLVIAALQAQGYSQPQPYTAAAWLSAILAVGVIVVMLAEHSIHGRQIHLVLASGFLSLAVLSVWEAVTLSSTVSSSSISLPYLALWKMEWVTLALLIVCGLTTNRAAGGKKNIGLSSAVMGIGVLWAALTILLVSAVPAVSSSLAGEAGAAINIGCGIVFVLACLIYGLNTFHRSNAVLEWMAYGLVFAVLAQTADYFAPKTEYGLLFGFATTMKILAYLSPLAGMLAEHTRMQYKLHDQWSGLNSLILAQQASTSSKSGSELCGRIVELTSASFSEGAVCLMPFNKERGLIHVATSTGLKDDFTRQFVFRPGEGPVGDCFSDKNTVFVRDVCKDEILCKKLDGLSHVNSAIFAPMLAPNDCLGVLAVFSTRRYRANQKLQKDQQRLLEALAIQAAHALQYERVNDRLLDVEKSNDDREREIVWEIGQAVASKLELHDLVDTLAEKLKIAVGAKACSVLVYDTDEIGLKIMGHRSLTRHQSIADHVDQCDQLSAMVAKKGEPVMANGVPNSCHCKYPELVVDDGGHHHLLSVPMSARGFMGAITVFRQNSEPFSNRESRLLMKLAPMVAVGIRNAELYEREKKIAESLQTCFMPTIAKEMPGIQISSLYEAAFDESKIGGDFYDISELGDGQYGVAIGDVAGKGLDAAVYTAMARYMIQAYSTQDADPTSVVSKLNAALYRYTPSSKFVTLVFGIIDTTAKSFTYVNAGHELPFLHDASTGEVTSLESTGPATGAVDDATYTSRTITFKSEDSLVFYTDGATEARNGKKFLGTEGLQQIVSGEIGKSYNDLPKAIMTRIRAFSDGPLRDDIAILVVKALTPGRLF